MPSGSCSGSGIMAPSISTGRIGTLLSHRRLDLDTDGIGGVHDAGGGVLASAEPIAADNGDEEVARGQRVGDMFAKVAAERNVVDVDEEAVLAKALDQAVEDAPRHGGICAPVGNDNFRGVIRGGHAHPSMDEQRLNDFASESETAGYCTGTTASLSRR